MYIINVMGFKNWVFNKIDFFFLWKRTRINILLNFRFSKTKISCWPSKMLQLTGRRIGLVVKWDVLVGWGSSVVMNMRSINKHRSSKRWRRRISSHHLINLFHSHHLSNENGNTIPSLFTRHETIFDCLPCRFSASCGKHELAKKKFRDFFNNFHAVASPLIVYFKQQWYNIMYERGAARPEEQHTPSTQHLLHIISECR